MFTNHSGATLLFDVELMGINQAPPPQNVFKQIDSDSNNQLSKEEVNNWTLCVLTCSSAIIGVAYFQYWIWLFILSVDLSVLLLFICLHGFNFKVADYIKKHIFPTEKAEEVPAEEGAPQQQDPLKITEEIFQHEDHDRDGYISFEEFYGPHDELQVFHSRDPV